MDAYWHRKKSFKGEFDGNGKTISGLYINGNTNCVGLFGHVGKDGTVIGTVKNVTVTDFYVSGSYYVGGICGRNDVGTLEGCTSGCTVNGTTNSAGGICHCTIFHDQVMCIAKWLRARNPAIYQT